MDLGKPPLLKKCMDRIGHPGTDPGNRPQGVGPWSQVAYFTQKFKGMPFFLQRIVFRVRPADDHNLRGQDLDLLALGR